MELFDISGNRKYLTPGERQDFKMAASRVAKDKRIFLLMLHHSGCRVSEATAVKIKDIDFSAQAVTFRTLKQHGKVRYRQVPLPDDYLQALDDAYDLRQKQKRSKSKDEFIWGWSRQYAHEITKEVMAIAGLNGIAATPKGLRHAYAIASLEKGVPLNMLQKWMGHSQLSTTAIYANAMGQQERQLAARLWN